MSYEEIAREVLREVERAVQKFPTWPSDALHAVGVVQEEAGELSKAVVQCTYEKHKATPADVREEAIQTAAMAIRFIASMDSYAFTPGEQHTQDVPDVMRSSASDRSWT